MDVFFGGNPLAVIIRLIIVSIVVGIVLSALNYDPRDLFGSIFRLINSIADMGYYWVQSAARYFLLGAVIVVPIWLMLRFFDFLFGGHRRGGPET